MSASVVVVGSSLAGLATVRELRGAGFDGTITVIGDEPHLPYDRPPLSKDYLVGDVDLSLAGADELDQLATQWLLGTRAVGVSTEADGRHTVHTTGDDLVADVVVLATGARPRVLDGSADVAGVCTLRTLDDALALRTALARSEAMVVIGAGFIGAEVAGAGRALGVEVTIVEASAMPLVGALGEEMARVCAGLHAANGVRLLTDVGIPEVVRDGDRAVGVRLADGTVLPADLVVVGIGALPNTEWLGHRGVVSDGGFHVDAAGRTDVSGIYAVGDCAATYDPHLGRHRRVEHWTSATSAARAVAADITGAAPPLACLPYFWSNQYGHQLQFAGYRGPTDTVRIVDGDPETGPFIAVYESDAQPVAVFARDSPKLFTRYRKQIEKSVRAAGLAVS